MLSMLGYLASISLTEFYRFYTTFCIEAFCIFFFQRVLTMEYVDGCKISDIDCIKKLGLSLYDVS